MTEQKTYDYIIIGSGMAGLVCGNILSKHNYKVLILEKNNQLGGCLQIFSREKKVFDTGVHYVGGLDKGQNTYQFFKYLGIIDDLKLHRLDENFFDVIKFEDNTTYGLGHGIENFKGNLMKDFPEEKEAILNFCHKMKETIDYFPLYNLSLNSEKNYYTNPEVLELNAIEFIDSITSNKKLKAVLLGNGLLYALNTKTPFYVLALILNSYIEGSHRFTLSGSQLTKALVKQIKQNGGEILKRKEVVSSQQDEAKNIISVSTKDGETYFAKTFISNLHPSDTIRVIGEDKFLKAYRTRINRLKNTISSFVLYITLKDNSLPYFNHNIYYHTNVNSFDETLIKSSWPDSIFISCSHESNNSKYVKTLCVISYMNYEEVEKWAKTHNTVMNINARGEDYEKFKEEKTKQIIKVAQKVIPNIKEITENIYTSTPLTYRDYLGNSDGSLYGIEKNSAMAVETNIQARTKIPNLFLTGQNIVFHGILGATFSGFITAFEFLDREKIINELNN